MNGDGRLGDTAAAPAGEDRSRPVALWLFAVAALVLAMVVVGGATRLTGSGLSITEWKPVSGALPPLSSGAWEWAFAAYRATPQYRLVNAGMSLAEFRSIFWWEWAHRLLGRLLGLAFAVPFLVFLALRRLPRRLIWRCVLLVALGALQGLVGWLMVKTGLANRVSVAAEALATHLGLAFILFCGLVLTGLEAGFGPPAAPRRDGWSLTGAALLAGIFVQCLLGALTAGAKGGFVDGDWPLMGGRFVPAGYGRDAPAAFLEGPLTAQFDHRLFAYLLLAFVLTAALAALRSTRAGPAIRALILALAVILCLQTALGVATLWSGVALGLALIHQANAVLALAVAVVLAWRARRTDRTAEVS